MDSKSFNPFSLILKASRPWLLLSAALFYVLGAGVAIHQGQNIVWSNFFFGLALIILLLLGGNYLKRFYDPPSSDPEKTPSSLSQQQAEHQIYLLAAITLLTIGAGLTIVLLLQDVLTWIALLVLGIAIALVLAQGIPPFRLVYSGYGELAETAVMTLMIPVFAQLLQLPQFHPLLLQMIFPLALIYLADLLALSLETYTAQLKFQQQTLIIRAGWEWGMRLHNYLLVSAFLLLALLALLGLPWSLAWRAFLAFPIAIYQIWQIWSISQGAPPNWKILRLTAVATVVMILYQWIIFLWTL